MTIQRYEIYGQYGHDADASENSEGEWVKYEDHQRLIAANVEKLKAAAKSYFETLSGYDAEVSTDILGDKGWLVALYSEDAPDLHKAWASELRGLLDVIAQFDPEFSLVPLFTPPTAEELLKAAKEVSDAQKPS